MREQKLKFVKYFGDFLVNSAKHRKFPCEIIHRKNQCQRGCYSLELILYGEVLLHLDDRCIHLKGPCVFWIGERSKFFQFEEIPGAAYEHYWLDFTGERGKRIYEHLDDAFPDSNIPLKHCQNILNIFKHFTDKYKIARRKSVSPEDTYMIEQLLFELYGQFPEEPENDIDPYGLKALATVIANAPFEKYDLHELAVNAGLSYMHFRVLFKEVHGITIGQYILQQQMLTAGELLKSGQFRIGELADYCGYPDIGSFSRAFKRYYKISPQNWRQKYMEHLFENQNLCPSATFKRRDTAG